MKKSLIAIIAAAAIATFSVPMFSGCSANVGYLLKTDENGNQYYSVGVEGNKLAMDGELVIPSEHDGLPVKEIESGAFTNTKVSKVTIPTTIEIIGTAAFAYNNSLKEVVFEEGSEIDTISWGLFGNCVSLEKVNIPSTVKTIDGYAFYNCRRFEQIDFPLTLEYINENAFEGCSALSSVEFPQSLKRIGDFAFYNCTSIQSIDLPDGMVDTEQPLLDENGEQVKDEKGNPATQFIPAVGAGSFHTCLSLKTAKIGAGSTVIESGVFGYCTALEEIYLPAGLKEIRGALYKSGQFYMGHAFHHDGALARIHFGGTQEQWSSVKINNTAVTVNGGTFDNSAISEEKLIFGA